MGRLYISSYSKNSQLGTKKRTLPRQITLGPNALKFIAIVIFAALGIVYLSQSTRGANLSVELRQLDTDQQSLERQIERLNAESARLKALDNIYSQSNNASMQPSSKINYLPGSSSVAKK